MLVLQRLRETSVRRLSPGNPPLLWRFLIFHKNSTNEAKQSVMTSQSKPKTPSIHRKKKNTSENIRHQKNCIEKTEKKRKKKKKEAVDGAARQRRRCQRGQLGNHLQRQTTHHHQRLAGPQAKEIQEPTWRAGPVAPEEVDAEMLKLIEIFFLSPTTSFCVCLS